MLQYPEDVAASLGEFWQALIAQQTEYLPGLEPVLSLSAYRSIARRTVLPILQHWRVCRKKVLREVLRSAFLVADHGLLLTVADNALHAWDPNDPGRYALWLGSAYLLAPTRYAAALQDYMGRSRERILPPLDFIVLVLSADVEQRLALSAPASAMLLQIIAPKFPPHQDQHGHLCDNSQKLLYLFYRLALSADPQAAAAIDRLSRVRVMKLFSDILQEVQTLLTRQAAVPSFDNFVADLQRRGAIRAKKNWSDGSQHCRN